MPGGCYYIYGRERSSLPRFCDRQGAGALHIILSGAKNHHDAQKKLSALGLVNRKVVTTCRLLSRGGGKHTQTSSSPKLRSEVKKVKYSTEAVSKQGDWNTRPALAGKILLREAFPGSRFFGRPGKLKTRKKKEHLLLLASALPKFQGQLGAPPKTVQNSSRSSRNLATLTRFYRQEILFFMAEENIFFWLLKVVLELASVIRRVPQARQILSGLLGSGCHQQVEPPNGEQCGDTGPKDTARRPVRESLILTIGQIIENKAWAVTLN